MHRKSMLFMYSIHCCVFLSWFYSSRTCFMITNRVYVIEKVWIFMSQLCFYLVQTNAECTAGTKVYSWPVWSSYMHCCDNSRLTMSLHYCRHWHRLLTVKVLHVVPPCTISACGCMTITATLPGLKLFIVFVIIEVSSNDWSFVEFQDFEVLCGVPHNNLCLQLLLQIHNDTIYNWRFATRMCLCLVICINT